MERFLPGEESTPVAPLDPAFSGSSASAPFAELQPNLDEDTDPFVADGLRRIAKMYRESS